MTLATTLSIVLTAFTVGLFIGTTAIGGVLLAPMLVFLLGMEVHEAVAFALWGFLWSGMIAVLMYARRGSVPWHGALWLCLAAAPAAWAGTLAAAHVSGRYLQGMIGGLMIAAGANVLRPVPQNRPVRPLPGPAALLALGALAGFGSAMLGAGGALILTPILIALDVAVLPAIGIGQLIQLPISAIASIVHVRDGHVTLPLALWLPGALAAGILVGVPIAHALPQRTLRRLLGLTMAISGTAIVVRTLGAP
jgi:uncharacterized protein